MSELARGAGDLGRAFSFLNQHPRLWAWVIAPAIVTLLLIIAAVVAIARLVSPLVGWLTDWLPEFLRGPASGVLSILVVIALAAGSLVVFASVAGVVAGPFNELLSEAVEERLTGRTGPPFSLRAFVRGALVGIAHGLRRVAAALVAFLAMFVLGFVPVIGTIAAAVLGFWLASRAAAYDCYDAVLSRRELSYRDKLAFLRARRSRSLGLGAAVTALLLVPGVNLVALGLGAAAATLAANESTIERHRAQRLR